MYSTLPSFVLGFHGCDEEVGESVLAGKTHLRKSENSYDWLGNGIYFWENNPKRALSYANHVKNHPGRTRGKVSKPFVVGAIIDLGCCLNLMDEDKLEVVKQGYEILQDLAEEESVKLPVNTSPIEDSNDLLLRHLDCAVIEFVHSQNEANNLPEYDTVRGVFTEGHELYPNAGFKEKNHIQICVRNLDCIKGYFRPIAI